MPQDVTVTVPTVDDVKEKASDVRDSVEDAVDAAEDRIDRLSTVKKVVFLSGAVVVGYSIVSAVVRRVLARNSELTLEVEDPETGEVIATGTLIQD